MIYRIVPLLYAIDLAICAYGLSQGHVITAYDRVAMPLSLVLLIIGASLTYIRDIRNSKDTTVP